MTFMQGRPDGTPQHPHPIYPVHLQDTRHETMMRDRLLCNKITHAICGNGGYHMWLTNNINEVTCLACKGKHGTLD